MFQKLFGRNGRKGQTTNGRYHHGNDHLIELRGVGKRYATAAGDFVALRRIDLQVDKGEFVAVVGKSGSGKSTLINMITGIDSPSDGEILVGDTAVHQLDENQIAQWRGRHIGVVFQFFQLLPTLTVVENVMLPMDFCDMYASRERRDRALHLLAQVDMVDQANKLPSAISGGQQQRVAIARALVNNPSILLADEPTGALDTKTGEEVMALFQELHKQGMTLIVVTHDMDIASQAQRIITLKDGQVISDEQNGHHRSRPADWRQVVSAAAPSGSSNGTPMIEREASYEAV